MTTAEPGGVTLADIVQILGRTGRPMARIRDIEATTTENALGWSLAGVDAGDTSLYVRQTPSGVGLLIEICTKTAAELTALTVTLGGQVVHPSD